MLCIETSTSLGSLHKFEGATGGFKGTLGSRHPLIASPDITSNAQNITGFFFKNLYSSHIYIVTYKQPKFDMDTYSETTNMLQVQHVLFYM